jgi:hypothetical protein
MLFSNVFLAPTPFKRHLGGMTVLAIQAEEWIKEVKETAVEKSAEIQTISTG